MAIEPRYVEVTPRAGLPKECWKQYYCVYFEHDNDRSYARYMSPTGWQLTCYYFNSEREAQLAFGQHGWKALPVNPQEIAHHKSLERLAYDFYDFDALSFENSY